MTVVSGSLCQCAESAAPLARQTIIDFCDALNREKMEKARACVRHYRCHKFLVDAAPTLLPFSVFRRCSRRTARTRTLTHAAYDDTHWRVPVGHGRRNYVGLHDPGGTQLAHVSCLWRTLWTVGDKTPNSTGAHEDTGLHTQL